jgi:NADH-quinone oxidoreductase subunit D
VQAVEDAGGIEVPERALYIRTLVGELERIHSHMLWVGLAGHFLGFNTVWMWVWRYREDVLDILERITGNRNHYGMMKPGGVHRDIKPEDIPAIKKMLDGLKKPWDLFRKAVIDDPVIHARLKGVGVITKQQIIDYCALGPTARASGVDIDVRRDHPHAAYGLVDWKVITAQNGDVFDKAVVRILETYESIKIADQCLEKLKNIHGPFDSNPKDMLPGEGVGHYEAPRGEVFHYIRSDGTNRPVRHKVRAPSFMNIATNKIAVVGQSVADATIILAAVDPCYCCTERLTAVDAITGKQMFPAQQFHRLAIEKTERIKREVGGQGPRLDFGVFG